jgi:hypothetical protein
MSSSNLAVAVEGRYFNCSTFVIGDEEQRKCDPSDANRELDYNWIKKLQSRVPWLRLKLTKLNIVSTAQQSFPSFVPRNSKDRFLTTMSKSY